MKSKSKVIGLVVLVIFLVLIFIGGWLWATANSEFLTRFFPAATDNNSGNFVASFTANDQKKIIENSGTQIDKILQTSLTNPALLLNCKELNSKDCSTSDTQTPPLQWVQYAKGYYSLTKTPNYNFKDLLVDLNTYPAKDFDWKLYQYGDLLVNQPGTYPEFEQKYLKITDELYTFTSVSAVDFKFYTAKDPARTEQLIGTTLSNKAALNSAVVNYATATNTLANAYIISSLPKYKIELSNLLNFIHLATFFDDPISTNDSELKITSCNTLLADVYAYKAIKDRAYLGYSDYLNTNNSFQKLYNADPATIAGAAKDPMKILPCLDAMQQLALLDADKASTYNTNYDYLLSFLKKNLIIISDSSDQYYGFVKLPDGQYDINSSAWLTKIMAAKLSSSK